MGNRKQETSTSVNLPSFVNQPLEVLSNRLGAETKNLLNDPFMGDLIAGPTQTENEAIRRREFTARMLAGETGARTLRDLGEATARGDFLRLESNPYIQDYITAATRPISEQYSEEIAPLEISDAIGRNSFDHLRRAFTIAQQRQDRDTLIGDIGTNILTDVYDRERDRQTQAGDLIQIGTALETLPDLFLQEAGTDRRALNQLDIDRRLANRFGNLNDIRALEEVLLPLAAAFGGQSSTAPGTNRLATGLQGAFGGASIGGQVTASPWGAIIGALLGGAGGALS